MTAAYLVLAIITVISAIPSLYFSAVEVRNPQREAREIAWYTTARSTALLVLAIVPLFGRFDGWLLAIAIAMIIVQAVDGVIGLTRGKPLHVIGPFVTVVVHLAVLIWFFVAG